MWREKFIRISWAVIAFNALVSIAQMFFSYGHYLKHEWWTMGISVFLILFNGYMAYWQFNNLLKMKQELKDEMWRTLQTPSEVLR